MNEQEIDNIFKTSQMSNIEANLREMITSFKMTNDLNNKKVLKAFFNYILNHLENKVEIDDAIQFLKLMFRNILQMANIFPEIMNEYMKKLLKELEEESFDRRKLINSTLLIVYLTNKLNQPNQLLTNFILLINLQLDKLKLLDESEENLEMNFLMKIYLMGVLCALSENTKSYIPNLFNHLEHSLHFIQDKISNLKNTSTFTSADSEINILKEIKLLEESNPSNNPNLFIQSFYKLLSIIKTLMRIFKDDLNFDIIFKNILFKIFEIKKLLNNQKANNKTKNNNTDQLHSLIELYEDYKTLALDKKNVEINFMIIKKKGLPSLEPDIDLSFLGRSFMNLNANAQKVAKAIQKKVSSTKKQAIRNLKKEAKVIDSQRQKVLQRIGEKRKEDQKLSNQFIEQTNIEYKKLVTSQPKKRLKVNRMKGKVRA